VPILLAIIMGGTGIGLLLIHRMQLQHAAQEVAVAAAQTDCNAGAARADVLLGYRPDTLACGVQGQTVTVQMGHSYPAIVPFLPEHIDVEARAVQR
jgi:hypothetical protein